jgi:hypothetical protein
MINYDNLQRRTGYADGKAGKPAIYADQHYQRGWREGMKRRDFLLDVAALSSYGDNWHEDRPDNAEFERITDQQEKNMRASTASRKLFVAVVFADRGLGATDSLKGDGQWSSFIGTTQAEAVKKALDARDRWDTSPIDRHKYVVLVGELTSKVKPRAAYDLVTLNG